MPSVHEWDIFYKGKPRKLRQTNNGVFLEPEKRHIKLEILDIDEKDFKLALKLWREKNKIGEYSEK